MALVVIVMAACSGGPGTSGSVPPRTQPTSPASPSLELASPGPSKAGAGESETFIGTLGFDAIEGGCAYLATGDGRRLEVIYPDGWQVRRSPLELVAPDGRVVAGAGDELTIRGAVAQDMVSICQIGPIIRAVEVVVR